MDEEGKVGERLARIERLREAGAPPSRLLAQVRALVVEGEAWLAAEREHRHARAPEDAYATSSEEVRQTRTTV